MASRLSRFLLAVLAILFTLQLQTYAAPVQLRFWECWGGQRTDWIKSYITQFEASYPNIKVSVETMTCDVMAQKFSVAYAGGVAPDLIMFQTFDIASFADKGLFVPLDSYISKQKLDRNIWYDSELASGNWNGIQYGLPVRAGGDANTILYYGTELFNQAGLNVKKLPETLKELTEVGKKLVRYGADGKVQVTPLDIRDQGGDFYNLAWIYAADGQFLSKDLRSAVFHQGRALQIVDELAKMNASWYRNPSDAQGGLSNFVSGKSAIYQTGAWEWSAISAYKDFDFVVGVRPRLSADVPYAGAHIGTWHYLIPQAGHPDESWELLRWLATRKDTIGDFLLRQGRLAPIKSFNNNPEYLNINKDIMTLAKAMSMAAPVQILPISRQLMEIHGTALKSVLNGQTASIAAMETARQKVQALLDEYWQTK